MPNSTTRESKITTEFVAISSNGERKRITVTTTFFEARISKQGERLYIAIPRALYPQIHGMIGKLLRVELAETQEKTEK